MSYYEDDDQTFEQRNDAYLLANPSVECGLWSEWVGVVCGWDKIAPPNQAEWDVLRSNFYHGKAPIASVAELKAMRARSEK